ncbi:MAG: putative serine/threonine-protein kinase Nek3, partial [Streblomastix strix]
ELRDAFQGFAVKDVDIVRRADDRPAGFGFIEFENEADQRRAIEQKNGFVLKDRKITIKAAGNLDIMEQKGKREQVQFNKINQLSQQNPQSFSHRTFTSTHITNIPSDMKEQELKEFVSQFGEIKRLYYSPYIRGQARYADIRFKTHAGANLFVNSSPLQRIYGGIILQVNWDLNQEEIIDKMSPPQKGDNQQQNQEKQGDNESEEENKQDSEEQQDEENLIQRKQEKEDENVKIGQMHPKQEKQQLLHSILALDSSESMRGEPYERLIVIVNKYIDDQTKNEGLISVFRHSDEAIIIYEQGNRQIGPLEIQIGGGNNFKLAMLKAIEIAGRNPPSYECKVIFFTNGQCCNCFSDEADQFDQFGISIDVVGFNGANQHILNLLTRGIGHIFTSEEFNSEPEIQQIASSKYKFEDFQVFRTLRSGAFGRVVPVKHKGTNELFIMKRVQNFNEEEKKVAFEEVKQLKLAQSKNVVQLIDAFSRDTNFCILQEYCSGGNFRDLIGTMESLTITQRKIKATIYMYQILSGLRRIHSLKIVHRNLKPENILIDQFGNAKIADFGPAILINESLTDIHPSETKNYTPPETHSMNRVTELSDVWALGVIIVELITGVHPFEGGTQEETITNIIKGKMKPLPEEIQGELKDMLISMLNVESDKRPTVDKLLSSELMEFQSEIEIMNEQRIAKEKDNYQFIDQQFEKLQKKLDQKKNELDQKKNEFDQSKRDLEQRIQTLEQQKKKLDKEELILEKSQIKMEDQNQHI